MRRISMALVSLLLTLVGAVSAQEKVYLDQERQTTEKENALYYRITNQYKVKEDTVKGNKHFMIMDYYLSGRMEMIGSFLSEKALVKDGPFVFYHPNGREKKRGIFRNDRHYGIWKFWDDKGKLQEERKYVSDEEHGVYQEYHVLKAFDKEGAVLVEDGEGNYEQYHPNGQIAVKGKVRKGTKIGIWRGFYPDGKPYYVENFQGGKLIKGISYDTKGKRFDYDRYYVGPQAKKGMDAFYAYVKRKMKYPTEAKNKGVHGEVLVQFTVDEKGEVKSTKVIKGIGNGCDEEAMALVANGPNWKAGMERGQQKTEKILVPIPFDL